MRGSEVLGRLGPFPLVNGRPGPWGSGTLLMLLCRAGKALGSTDDIFHGTRKSQWCSAQHLSQPCSVAMRCQHIEQSSLCGAKGGPGVTPSCSESAVCSLAERIPLLFYLVALRYGRTMTKCPDPPLRWLQL